MHMVICALVEASTEDEALAAGKTVCDRLVGAEMHSCAVFERTQSNSQGGLASPTFKYQTGDTRECIDGR